MADCNKAIELNPYDAPAYTGRGLAKHGLKQYQEALADYTKSIELDSKLARTYNNRGVTKAELKQY